MTPDEKEVIRKLLTQKAESSGKQLKAGEKGPIGINDFDLLKVLGKGSFGKVMLVQHKGTKQIHAMKTLRKAQLLRRNQLAHTATERGVLQKISSPFLMSLDYAWQSDTKLYMVMSFCSGGELFHWLKQQKRFSLKRVLLYTSEMLLAISTLHSHDVIYRDLKPENVLLDAMGHIKLTDFGLSKEGVSGAGSEDGTATFCGTPEYLAPEILENKGHGKAVDWWSLGTLMFEMLVGLPPFYDKNMKKMYDKILHQEIKFPDFVTLESQSLLRGLLTRKVQDRLGSGEDDGDEIKDHPFFDPLDWAKVLAMTYTPAFKPPVQGEGDAQLDVGNFDAEFTNEKVEDSLHQSDLLGANIDFQNFTFESSGGALGK